MLSQKLFSLLGLAFSVHALALPPPAEDDMAKQLTFLMTDAHHMMPDVGSLKGLGEFAQHDPGLQFEQLHNALSESVTTLHDLNGKHGPLLTHSLVEYYRTVFSRLDSQTLQTRKGLYRDAIYSTIVDLYHSYPQQWNANVELSIQNLKAKLGDYARMFEEAHVKPMGSPEAQARYQEQLELLQKQADHLKSHLMKILTNKESFSAEHSNQPLTYRSIEDINKLLAQTNKPNVTPAEPITGNFMHLIQRHPNALPTLAQKNSNLGHASSSPVAHPVGVTA